VLFIKECNLEVVSISTFDLLEDVEFRSFIRRESNEFYRSVKRYNELTKTNFVQIIALAQYGQIHDVSMYAAIKREFKEIKFSEEVVKEFPFFRDWSIRYRLNLKTVILAVLTSIMYEGKIISKHGTAKH
jgi:hypothetical protein